MSNYEQVVEKVLCFDYLPSGEEWALADENGWTVAHVYAGKKRLPTSFDQYALTDITGCSVAHQAAAYGNLPINFVDWRMVDAEGRTVAFIAGQFERRKTVKENARKSPTISPERKEAESNLLGTFITLLKESDYHKRTI